MNNLIKFLLFKWKPRTIHGKIYRLTVGYTVYIGGTTQRGDARFQQHIKALKSGKHTNQTLQDAYNNWGKIKIDILWYSDSTYHDILAQMENHYMNMESPALLCNMKPARADDYSPLPTSKSNRWTYPLFVWLIIMLPILFILDILL